MSNLTWQLQRSLENSFAFFIQTEIDNTSLTVADQNGDAKNINVRVGYDFNKEWTLPVIQIYVDTPIAPRLSIGTNKRQNSYLMIIDVRAINKGMQLDLTDWLVSIINDGFPYYSYTINPSDPNNPTKTLQGLASIDFVSNVPLKLGTDVDLFDKYRQNITISVTIANC